jgi:hypothetical protein
MKFLMKFEADRAAREHASGIQRFQSMGAQVPKGARLIGRWLRADESGGFDVLETEDPDALNEFARLWSRLVRLRLEPLSESGLAAALAGATSGD